MKFSKKLKILKKCPHFKTPQLFFHNFPQVKLNWLRKLKISSFIWEGSQLGGTRCLKVVNPFFWKSRFFDEKLWFFKKFFDHFLIKIISRKNWIIWKGSINHSKLLLEITIFSEFTLVLIHFYIIFHDMAY